MSDVLPWENEEKRNHILMVSVVDDIVAEGLRIVFKQEWNSRYQARFGAWDDTSASGHQLFYREKARPRPNKDVFQAKFRDGDTNEWDCSVLFDAILWSYSIGESSLNPTIKSEVENLRTLRNGIKHPGKATSMLSDDDFQTMITDVENAFLALGLPINDITQMKNQRNQYKWFQVLPSMPTHEVVYRSGKINQILQELATLRNSVGKLTYYYISGNPGSGKSQLSRQLCEKLFEGVNWQTETAFVMTLNGKDPDALLGSYQRFCRRLNCCDSILVNIMNSCKSKEGKIEDLRSLITTQIKTWKKWWIIVDNVEDLNMIHPLLPERGDKDWNNGQIILTIQNTTSVPCDSSFTKHISLSDGMESEECRQLLSLLSGTDVNNRVLDEVAEKLDHQPLAMAAASVYLQKVRETEFSWKDYIKKLEEGKRHIMDETFRNMNSAYPFTMSVAVGLALEKIAEHNFILEHTFNLFSHISFHPLPLDVIVQYIQQLNQAYDKEEIYLAIKDCSLFIIENDGRDVRLHRVVHEAIKTFCACNETQIRDNPQIGIPSKRAKVDVDGKVQNVVKALYCFKDRDDKIKMIPHLQAFAAAVKKLFPKQKLYPVWSALGKHEISEIYLFFGQTLYENSESKLGLEFQISNLRIWRGQENNLPVIPIYELLGWLYMDLNRNKKAKEFFTRLVKLSQKFKDEPSVDVGNAYARLGAFHFARGNKDEAESYILACYCWKGGMQLQLI